MIKFPVKLKGAFKVSFNLDDGKKYKIAIVKKNYTVAKPTDPVKEGYTFEGWYNGDTAFDFTTLITENLELVAKFSSGSETFRFEWDGTTSEGDIDSGSTIAHRVGDIPENFSEKTFIGATLVTSKNGEPVGEPVILTADNISGTVSDEMIMVEIEIASAQVERNSGMVVKGLDGFADGVYFTKTTEPDQATTGMYTSLLASAE